ncbi:ERF family protein [Intestinibacillus massiliensis]
MNVYQRIAAVMQDVQYLAKDDQVSFGQTKYKAISEEKVTRTVRESLVKNGLVVIPVSQVHHREGSLSTVDVTYRIQNAEDPEDYVLAVSSGTGADTQDKGVGKAMTYAYKYLFLRTFAIPTGEDPDKVSSAELDDREKRKAAQQAEGQGTVAITPAQWNKLIEVLTVLDGKRPTAKRIEAVSGMDSNSAKSMSAREWDFIMQNLNRELDRKGDGNG